MFFRLDINRERYVTKDLPGAEVSPGSENKTSSTP